jgi:hypothetical protein
MTPEKPKHTLKVGDSVRHPHAGNVKIDEVLGDKVRVSFYDKNGFFCNMTLDGEHLQKGTKS